MAEHRRWRFRQRQQFLQRLSARFKGKITARNIVRIDNRTGTAQRLNIALQAVVAQRHLFRPGNAANPLMPQLLEIVYGVERGGEVINVDRR